ncbi:hypothetical protein Tco_0292089, partial [Tanacetum coccineum]
FEHDHVVMNPTSAGMGYRHHRITCKFTLVIIDRYGRECLWFRSCTSCSRYQSVSKQTTRYRLYLSTQMQLPRSDGGCGGEDLTVSVFGGKGTGSLKF